MMINYIFLILLVIIYCFIFYGFIYYSRTIDAYNRYFGAIALIVIFSVLSFILFLILVDSTFSDSGFLMIILLYIPIIGAISLTFFSTIYVKMIRNNPKFIRKTLFVKIGIKLSDKIDEMNKQDRDSLRKTNHILIFLSLIGIWVVCLIVVVNVSGSSEGMAPEDSNMFLVWIQLFLNFQNRREIFHGLGWFYYVILFFFYSFFIIVITNEFTRKSNHFVLPFNYISRLVLMEEENKGYGSYLYFTIGHLFASFFCPPMVLYAILGISSIADLMASQVGMRYGKRAIKWNNRKTWEGTLSATVTSFFICFFLLDLSGA